MNERDAISKAAGALGSIRSERKATSSAANGRLGGRGRTREQRARERIDGMGFNALDTSIIWADWPNWDEHIDWLLKASKTEIIDWIGSSK